MRLACIIIFTRVYCITHRIVIAKQNESWNDMSSVHFSVAPSTFKNEIDIYSWALVGEREREKETRNKTSNVQLKSEQTYDSSDTSSSHVIFSCKAFVKICEKLYVPHIVRTICNKLIFFIVWLLGKPPL